MNRLFEKAESGLRNSYLEFVSTIRGSISTRAEKVALHWVVKLVDVATDRSRYKMYRYPASKLLSLPSPKTAEEVSPQIVWDTELATALSWVSWKYPIPYQGCKKLMYAVVDCVSGAPVGVVYASSPPRYAGGRLSVFPELVGRGERHMEVLNRFLWLRRIGAVEPFSYYLGGKLLALSLFSEEVQIKHREMYRTSYIAVELMNLFGTSAVYHNLRLPNGRNAVYARSWTKGNGDLFTKVACFFPQSKLQVKWKDPNLRPYLEHGFSREYVVLSLVKGDLRKKLHDADPELVSWSWDEIVSWWKKKYLSKRKGKPYTDRSFQERILKELEWIDRLRESVRDPISFKKGLFGVYQDILTWEVC